VFGEWQQSATSAYNAVKDKIDEGLGLIREYKAALIAKREAEELAKIQAEKAAAAEARHNEAVVAGTATSETAAAAETARAAATQASTVATETGTAAMKIFKIAMASTGIGLLVVALGTLVSYFTSTNEGAKAFKIVMGAVNAVVQQGLKVLGSLGKIVYDVVTGNFQELGADVKAASNNIVNFTGNVKESAKAGAQLTNERYNLTKAEREWSTQRIEDMGKIDVLEKKASKQSALSAADKVKAAKEAKRLREEVFNTDVKFAQKNEQLVNKEQSINSKKDYQAIADAKNRTAQLIATKNSEIQSIENKEGKAGQLVASNADKAFNKKLKNIEAEKAQSEAAIKSETDYQSTDFYLKQSYSKRIFEADKKNSEDILKLKRDNKKITQQEYEQGMQQQEAMQTAFNNAQIKDLQKFYEDKTKALSQLINESLTDQLADVERKYSSALKEFDKAAKASGNDKEPVKKSDETDEQFDKRMQDYKNFVLNRAFLETQIETQKAKEIADIQESYRNKQISDIEKIVSREYDNDLKKFSDNEREKLKVEETILKEQIEKKKAAGLSTYEDEAKLRGNQTSQAQLSANIELLQANLTAQQKHDIKAAELAKEQELYKGNADKEAQINAERLANDKELANARIATFESWSGKTIELLSAANEFTKQIEQGQLNEAQSNHDKEVASLDKKLEKGLISQKVHDSKVKAEDQKLADEKLKIQRQQAIREKAIKMFEIGVNTAAAIMKAAPNIPLEIATAALGAIQLATVVATPLPTAGRGMFVKASNGTLLNGPSHAQGGIPIEAEGGEAIINKRSTAMFGPLLSAINEAGGGVKFASGGVVGMYATGGVANARFTNDGGYTARQSSGGNGLTKEDIENIEKAMTNAVSKVQVYASIEEIRQAAQNYIKMENIAKI
jgi:hypothetical protein